MFKLLKTSTKSLARLGRLKTTHGEISTPFFMPIATKGAVKNLMPVELKDLGAEIILSNTYHLWLRPGLKVLNKVKGLHNFMQWPGPILTDSGGYQVFSLTKLRKISEAGIKFKDPTTGEQKFLTPELAIKIQQAIGSDIMMALDECPPYPATKDYVKKSLALTERWALRCLAANQKNSRQQLFGIVQGGIYKDLRQAAAQFLADQKFAGYALGGLAVGEPIKKMYQVLTWTVPFLPADKPRYLMGLGLPEQIVEAVKRGIDMFDCVIPTREARHGRLYLWRKSALGKGFYQTINITNAKFANNFKPINQTTLKKYSLAYLHHLFKTKEPLAMRLATVNNLDFYLTLMAKIRQEIKQGKF
ncbi:MAG: tRNA guanosine(34) transglycosylase Tgt [Candidatus Buchananbacteria bacterium]